MDRITDETTRTEVDRPLPQLTDKDQLRRLIQSATKINKQNYQHYQDHFNEIQETYGGRFVAIHEGRIIDSIAFTDDLDSLRDFISELRNEHGEAVVQNAYLTHVPEEDQLLIL